MGDHTDRNRKGLLALEKVNLEAWPFLRGDDAPKVSDLKLGVNFKAIFDVTVIALPFGTNPNSKESEVKCVSLKTVELWTAAGIASVCTETDTVTITGACSDYAKCQAYLQSHRGLLKHPRFEHYTEDTMYFKVDMDALDKGDVRLMMHPLNALFVVVRSL